MGAAGRRRSENLAPSLRRPSALSIGRQRVLEINWAELLVNDAHQEFFQILYFQ